MNAITAFRSDDNIRARLSEILSEETLVRAIFAIRDSASNDDISDKTADPIASVRILSRRAGWHGALDALLSLTQPLPEPPAELGESNYGVTETEE
jgi:hypothetical protein